MVYAELCTGNRATSAVTAVQSLYSIIMMDSRKNLSPKNKDRVYRSDSVPVCFEYYLMSESGFHLQGDRT